MSTYSFFKNLFSICIDLNICIDLIQKQAGNSDLKDNQLSRYSRMGRNHQNWCKNPKHFPIAFTVRSGLYKIPYSQHIIHLKLNKTMPLAMLFTIRFPKVDIPIVEFIFCQWLIFQFDLCSFSYFPGSKNDI